MTVLVLFNFDPFNFSSLIAVSRTSKTMLNGSGKSGYPCFVLCFRGNDFSYSPLCMLLPVGLSGTAFIMLKWFPSIRTCWRVFVIKGRWILSKGFSTSVEMIICFLILQLLKWYITLIDLWILKNSYIPEINATLSWCMILFIYYLSQFAFFKKIFPSIFISDIGL